MPATLLVIIALTACGGGKFDVNQVDADGDGFTSTLDCNDHDANINPDATEICDGVDNDCNGTIDDNMKIYTFHPDADGDGYGDPSVTKESCATPAGYVQNDKDCNDHDDKIRPSAVDVCDNVDNDCSGAVDDDPSQAPAWYVDADADGYGTDSEAVVHTCDPQVGLSTNNRDCNDTDGSINPGADDVCDGIDNDCDGKADNDVNFKPKWYRDNDGDGYGDSHGYAVNCVQPAGYVDNIDDCDDTRSSVHPGGDDVCNGLDDDCNGAIDDNPANFVPWYVDLDKDGYGTTPTGNVSCTAPNNTSAKADGDCNDTDRTVHPNAQELCNSIDENCNAIIDENGQGALSWYPDADLDGFGLESGKLVQCAQPDGMILTKGDCNDEDPTVYPGAVELCNHVDDDCDGSIDEAAPEAPHWYADADADGYGDPVHFTIICDQPAGTVANRGDCADGDPAIYPFAGDSYGDGVDGDCDGRDSVSEFDANGVYFALSFEDENWYDADKYCGIVGYDGLAVPQDAAEQDFFVSMLVDAGKDGTDAPWIGLTDEVTEGTWLTKAGDIPPYFAWSPARPDGDENDNCAQMNWPLGTDTWNDLSCWSARPTQATLCETRTPP